MSLTLAAMRDRDGSSVEFVSEAAGCPRGAACVASDLGRRSRHVACLVATEDVVVVAYVWSIEPARFVALGGYEALAKVAAGARAIRP